MRYRYPPVACVKRRFSSKYRIVSSVPRMCHYHDSACQYRQGAGIILTYFKVLEKRGGLDTLSDLDKPDNKTSAKRTNSISVTSAQFTHFAPCTESCSLSNWQRPLSLKYYYAWNASFKTRWLKVLLRRVKMNLLFTKCHHPPLQHHHELRRASAYDECNIRRCT